jgi:hypothetical protein
VKQLLRLAAACSALGLAGTAQAQDDPSSWPVRTEGAACAIRQTFEHPDFGRQSLQVSYDPAAARVTLTATAALADTATLGESPRLGVVFLHNGVEDYDPGWGLRPFTRSSSGGVGLLATAFEGRRNVDQVLEDLAKSQALGFMKDGKVIVGFELREAAQGIAKLRECARRTPS